MCSLSSILNGKNDSLEWHALRRLPITQMEALEKCNECIARSMEWYANTHYAALLTQRRTRQLSGANSAQYQLKQCLQLSPKAHRGWVLCEVDTSYRNKLRYWIYSLQHYHVWVHLYTVQHHCSKPVVVKVQQNSVTTGMGTRRGHFMTNVNYKSQAWLRDNLFISAGTTVLHCIEMCPCTTSTASIGRSWKLFVMSVGQKSAVNERGPPQWSHLLIKSKLMLHSHP